MTSVVIDSVPRQTFVGVGQGGMRALRYLGKKEMAFIINTQDADHPSLTFLDFQAARGREEGVSMEIGHVKGARVQRHTSAKGGGGATANYNVTYGASLINLAERRIALTDQLQNDKSETILGNFTPLGLQTVKELIVKMASGNEDAVGRFTEIIQPWIARVRQKIEMGMFGSTTIEEQILQDAVTDIIMKLLTVTRAGGIQGWGRFSARFKEDLRSRYRTILRSAKVESREELMPIEQLDRIATHDKDELSQSELRDGIDQALKILSLRENDVLRRRMNGETLKNIGISYAISEERINQIFYTAKRKIAYAHLLPTAVRDWVEENGNNFY